MGSAAHSDIVKTTVISAASGTVRTYRLGALSVLAVGGTVSPSLLKVLEQQAERISAALGLDLSELKGIQPVLISVLERIRRRQERRGNRLTLLNPPDQLLELLSLRGFKERYVIEEATGKVEPASKESEPAEDLSTFNISLYETEEIQQGLVTAEHRVAAFLPKEIPLLAHWRFEVCWRPSGRIGGDFYDFILLPGGWVGVAVGDVSGHGIPGAVVMGIAKKVLRLRALELAAEGPAAVLRQLNVDLLEDFAETTFVTVLYAVLEPDSGKIRFARAGHELPLLVTPASADPQPLESPGMAIGMSAPEIFDKIIGEATLELQPGSSLVLLTDGVPDAVSAEGARFGKARIRGVLGGAPSTRPLKPLMRALDRFTRSSPQPDDITVVAMARL